MSDEKCCREKPGYGSCGEEVGDLMDVTPAAVQGQLKAWCKAIRLSWPNSKELSFALMKLEEAQMWLKEINWNTEEE